MTFFCYIFKPYIIHINYMKINIKPKLPMFFTKRKYTNLYLKTIISLSEICLPNLLKIFPLKALQQSV